MANSTYLANYCARYNPRSHYVGQGCDLDIFVDGKNAGEPAELSGNSSTGVLATWRALQSTSGLDMDLLHHIAVQRPEWGILYWSVQKTTNFCKVISTSCRMRPSSRGRGNISDLPAYITFTPTYVSIRNCSTRSRSAHYPRKIDEYLAIGKPVAATATDAMSVFSEHVYLGKSKEDYAGLIEKALAEDSQS